MTDQHPLTDRICFNILSNKYDVSGLDWHKYQDEVDLMRAATDWQLEQVLEWLEDNLGSGFYLERYWDGDSGVDVDCVIKDLREAMRPTTTQENN